MSDGEEVLLVYGLARAGAFPIRLDLIFCSSSLAYKRASFSSEIPTEGPAWPD